MDTGIEREAMTLERELRAHVAGMQCAIDNCGISPKEWDAAAKYAMDNIGEWKRLLSDYAQHLARAAEPVAWIIEWNDPTYRGKRTVSFDKCDPDDGRSIPLYTHPPEPARDAKCKWSQDVDGNWETDCGNLHILIDGTPYDNEMGFCCYCGHAIDQVLYHDAAMAQESGE